MSEPRHLEEAFKAISKFWDVLRWDQVVQTDIRVEAELAKPYFILGAEGDPELAGPFTQAFSEVYADQDASVLLSVIDKLAPGSSDITPREMVDLKAFVWKYLDEIRVADARQAMRG